MINVSSATKAAWMSDRKVNHIVISFPNLNLTYGNDSIDPDSLSWSEALCNADSMEFVGCIASSFGASIYNIPDNVKGQYIEVTFQAGTTDIIPIFKGYVDSVEIESDSLFKKIKAYDALYNAGQIDVAEWYARLALPMTLGAIRASLMTYVGLTEVEDTELPNDDVIIQRTLENPDTIKGLTVIKSICQLNGACGIINRDGEFEYRYVKESMESSYDLLYHESLKYEEFYCNPIQRVQIRDMEDDAGVTTSSYGNKYIIQGNMFAYELATDTLYSMANNILDMINGFTYHPMRSLQNGLPFFEVGDTLECVVDPEGYGIDTFLILSRTLTGVQYCRDTFEARGTQNQSEYITDIQAQVNVLKRTTNELKNLSTKIVDYILPTDIEESDISDGSNSDVLTFEFYNSAEDEKSSFYSMINFEAETSADLQTDTYGDCALTISFILDGQTREVVTQTYGDGDKVLMLNYLLDDLVQGNHTFVVRFALSGGSISSMRAVSAYILAASVIETGNYSEDYDIEMDDDFVEYMTEGDQEIIGDYVELEAPTGGSGNGQNFSGNQFCEDWIAAFILPFEYADIFTENNPSWFGGHPSTEDESDWAGFTNQSWVGSTNAKIWAKFIDDDVYSHTGHHINVWFARLRFDSVYKVGYSIEITGMYVPSNVGWKVNGNYPQQGYMISRLADNNGSLYVPIIYQTGSSSRYCLFGNPYSQSGFTSYSFNGESASFIDNNNFILVYNVEAFKTYLSGLSTETLRGFANSIFMLAECNISKERRRT